MKSPGFRRGANAAADSDVTRSRGLIVGALVASTLVVLALAGSYGPRALAAPGPVARHHGSLACSDCHAPSNPAKAASSGSSTQTSCTACHGKHESRHPTHRELARVGELRCGDCHAVHRDELAIRFSPGQKAELIGTGFEATLSTRSPAGLSRAVTVPLVGVNACVRCHDTKNAGDAAAGCFPAEPTPLARIGCFDEHRRPAERGGSVTAERDAAIEAARALSPAVPAQVASRALVTPGAVVVTALASALIGMGALGRLARRKQKRPSPVLQKPGEGPRRLPSIDAARCLGCHACVDACPYDVLELRRYVAVVARPDACCGAGPCEARCPNGSLTLAVERTESESHDFSAVAAREGFHWAGDVAGGALIRTAIEQGVAVAQSVKRALEREPRTPHGVLDLLVVGAGPAGLAAALTAERLGLRVEVIETGKVGESIRRFSRRKLILDNASDLDGDLPLFIGNVEKEELLERWLYAVRRAHLVVREGVRAVGLEARDAQGVSRVRAVSEAGEREFAARHVLVAVGRRGTPRTLAAPIAPAVLGRVHYELSDARAFAGQRVVVVGLGDVAMEAAVALAAQPGTRVSVIHRGTGFRRGKQRNIDALSALVARGRVDLILSSEPSSVDTAGVTLRDGRIVPFDTLFVAIGSLPETNLLASLGIARPARSG
jgi:thioredoxin reductase/NAD-dependent dihydropyrimidine dehydrogenase PreA subunit